MKWFVAYPVNVTQYLTSFCSISINKFAGLACMRGVYCKCHVRSIIYKSITGNIYYFKVFLIKNLFKNTKQLLEVLSFISRKRCHIRCSLYVRYNNIYIDIYFTWIFTQQFSYNEFIKSSFKSFQETPYNKLYTNLK